MPTILINGVMADHEGKTVPIGGTEKDMQNFYEHGRKYWETVPADVNGMLGGFGHISNTDIQGSERFLKPFFMSKNNPIEHRRALDCGSGIGRVTKHLLMRFFDQVDMVEQNQSFLDESISYIGEDCKIVDQRICSALQDFVPQENFYNVIWCQWILSHLTDKDVIGFFSRCQRALTSNGLLIIKDNLTSSGETEKDEDDSTVSRPLELLRDLVKQSGFGIIREQKQQRFPKELYQVRMFACRVAEKNANLILSM